MSKLTKEQLHGMSDFEVNKALAEMLDDFEAPPEGCVTEIIGGKLFYRSRHHGSYFECHKGYCEEPNDIMPLAFEYGIDYKRLPSTGSFAAEYAYDITTHFIDTNPLRAIACCLILVLQEKQQ